MLGYSYKKAADLMDVASDDRAETLRRPEHPHGKMNSHQLENAISAGRRIHLGDRAGHRSESEVEHQYGRDHRRHYHTPAG
jgi:hypothetical protein